MLPLREGSSPVSKLHPVAAAVLLQLQEQLLVSTKALHGVPCTACLGHQNQEFQKSLVILKLSSIQTTQQPWPFQIFSPGYNGSVPL